MAFHFGLTTLSGTAIGEVHNAYERKVTLPLNNTPTASFHIGFDNPLATEITDRGGDVLLKVYQDSTLRFIGECVSIEEITRAEEGKPPGLACVFAGPLWRLEHRLCGKYSGYAADTFLDQDRGTIIWSLINSQNLGTDTGIRQGVITTSTIASAGPWYYKPIKEAMQELVAIAAPEYKVKDEFTIQSNGDLTGQATQYPAPGSGHTWGWTGEATGIFNVQNFVVLRDHVSDPDPNLGRAMIAGTVTATDVLVQCDVFVSSSQAVATGVMARWQDTNNWVIGTIGTYGSTIFYRIMKRQAGAYTVVATSDVAGSLTPEQWYTVQLQVDTSGNLTLRSALQGSPLVDNLTATDSAFATAGALASGRVGFYDRHTGSGACERYYNNFKAVVPGSGVKRVDFELVPSEPTADAGGVKIATLNVKDMVGALKPNVIFEYGSGMKGYTRRISRDGLLNIAYSLPEGFPENKDVMVADNPASRAARGLFEEVVPGDLQERVSRQLWADENVRIRGVPRELVTFEPSSTAPVFGTDYVVGDTVTARAKVQGSVRFNGLMRIYGVEVTINEEGKVDISPTLHPE